MSDKTTKRTRKPKGKPRLSQPRAARILRCSREHLNRVINGKLHRPQLLALYNDLMARNEQLFVSGTNKRAAARVRDERGALPILNTSKNQSNRTEIS